MLFLFALLVAETSYGIDKQHLEIKYCFQLFLITAVWIISQIGGVVIKEKKNRKQNKWGSAALVKNYDNSHAIQC